MNQNERGIHKAAILVDSLDQATADDLLEQMGADFAQLVRQAMVDLGDVDPAEQRRVIDEFLRIEPMPPAGIDLEKGDNHHQAHRLRPVGSPSIGNPQPSRRHSREGGNLNPQPSTSPQPFRLLRDAEAAKVAKILGDERPQTIALVLAHLPSEQAGGVLVHLAPRLQVDVIHRLVDLDRTEPEILRDVEEALESRLSEHIQMQDRRVAGLSAVTGMLEAAGMLHPEAGPRILGNLGAASPLARQLADRLAPKPLEFAELVWLDAAALAAVLEAAGSQLLTLALVGAPAELSEHYLDRLPQVEAAGIRDELNQLGPTRLSDVTEARRRIAELAGRMAAEGRIRWPGKTANEHGPRSHRPQPVSLNC